MKSHKYKFGRRINWRSILLAVVFPICFTVSHYANLDNTYVAEPKELSVFMTATVVEPELTIEDKFKEYFPKSHKTMLAIAKAESGLNNNATNWNCWYDKNGKISKTYIKNGGKACKKEDRKYSFGVDCFTLQAHYPGRKSCPEGVTIDMHLREMAELSKSRGFQPWVTYNLGMHKKYLAQN